MTAFGGVTMQEINLTYEKERMSGAVRGILAAFLFVLVIGIWVFLWIPAAPIF